MRVRAAAKMATNHLSIEAFFNKCRVFAFAVLEIDKDNWRLAWFLMEFVCFCTPIIRLMRAPYYLTFITHTRKRKRFTEYTIINKTVTRATQWTNQGKNQIKFVAVVLSVIFECWFCFARCSRRVPCVARMLCDSTCSLLLHWDVISWNQPMEKQTRNTIWCLYKNGVYSPVARLSRLGLYSNYSIIV